MPFYKVLSDSLFFSEFFCAKLSRLGQILLPTKYAKDFVNGKKQNANGFHSKINKARKKMDEIFVTCLKSRV